MPLLYINMSNHTEEQAHCLKLRVSAATLGLRSQKHHLDHRLIYHPLRAIVSQGERRIGGKILCKSASVHLSAHFWQVWKANVPLV